MMELTPTLQQQHMFIPNTSALWACYYKCPGSWASLWIRTPPRQVLDLFLSTCFCLELLLGPSKGSPLPDFTLAPDSQPSFRSMIFSNMNKIPSIFCSITSSLTWTKVKLCIICLSSLAAATFPSGQLGLPESVPTAGSLACLMPLPGLLWITLLTQY